MKIHAQHIIKAHLQKWKSMRFASSFTVLDIQIISMTIKLIKQSPIQCRMLLQKRMHQLHTEKNECKAASVQKTK